MPATKNILAHDEAPVQDRKRRMCNSSRAGVGLSTLVILTSLLMGYAHLKGRWPFVFPDSRDQEAVAPKITEASQTAKPELRLSRKAIDLLLDSLDEAKRRKDAEGILRHIAPDAIITIHMKQGAQQQMATLTREEYRTTLAMSFAFPSGNDYARINTAVSFAPDERSAKVSFKSTETLRQPRRELKIEGEETLVFRIREGKPMIVSLEQVVPGDST
jgi:hypothetical protein